MTHVSRHQCSWNLRAHMAFKHTFDEWVLVTTFLSCFSGLQQRSPDITLSLVSLCLEERKREEPKDSLSPPSPDALSQRSIHPSSASALTVSWFAIQSGHFRTPLTSDLHSSQASIVESYSKFVFISLNSLNSWLWIRLYLHSHNVYACAYIFPHVIALPKSIRNVNLTFLIRI